jgi:hypothetical protein
LLIESGREIQFRGGPAPATGLVGYRRGDDHRCGRLASVPASNGIHQIARANLREVRTRLHSLLPCSGQKIPCSSKSFSLLIFTGNCSRSDSSTAVSRHGIRAWNPKNAKFPVKFPVSREFARRLERSALRRQPAIPASVQAAQDTRDWAGNAGFSPVRFRLQTPNSIISGRQLPKVSRWVRDIPVLRRLSAETRCDHDCRPRRQCDFAH